MPDIPHADRSSPVIAVAPSLDQDVELAPRTFGNANRGCGPDLNVIAGSTRGVKRIFDDCSSRSSTANQSRLVKRLKGENRPGSAPDLSSFPFQTPTLPTSSLLCSHNARLRPQPLSGSGFEVGATMLTRTREDGTVITTVQLPRWSFADAPSAGVVTGCCGHVCRELSWQSSFASTVSPGTPLAWHALSQIGVVELLQQDGRPTFVVDLDGESSAGVHNLLRVVFVNDSLRTYSGLVEAISGMSEDESAGAPETGSYFDFRDWINSPVRGSPNLKRPQQFPYSGFDWTCTSLRRRFRIVSGLPDASTKIPKSPSCGTKARNSVDVGDEKRRALDFEVEGSQQASLSVPEQEDYFGAPTPRSDSTYSPMIVNSANGSWMDGIPNGFATPSGHLNHPESQSPAETSPFITSPQPARRTTQRRQTSMVPHPVVSRSSTGYSAVADPTGNAPGYFDWTRVPSSANLPAHVQFARSVDWASTSLGPMEHWPPALRIMCNFMMASPFPAAMYWGRDLTIMYNEAYIPLAGEKHPALMGRTYMDGWKEVWDEVKDSFDQAFLTGQATMKDDDMLYLHRSGFLEETYFSWALVPLLREDGTVVGVYNPAFEKTRRKVAERRMLTLREIGERTASARDVKGFWGEVLKGLEGNGYDAPFVLLYHVTDDADSEISSIDSISAILNKSCTLEGCLGVLHNEQVAPKQLDFKTSDEGFAPYFREALHAEQPILLEVENGTLPAALVEGLERRGFDDQCRAAVVCPIYPITGDAVLGFLVMGLNPRRPYDDDYKLFVQLLSRQLATSMASVVLYEEEIKRGQRAARQAALDRIRLSEQLAARTQEAVESETKFTRMAEYAPVGMFIADGEGRLLYLNDRWFEMARYPKRDDWAEMWPDAIHDEDRPRVLQVWNNIIVRGVPATIEFKFKQPWEGLNGVRGENWVLTSAFPEKAADGSIKSIFGCVTNISEQKWAEDYQKQCTKEAIETKRQQENFIDITSHEMRNPLSAILQCADGIVTSLSEYRDQEDITTILPAEVVDSTIDAAQTISLCAQHQKRIVDDVLTLSKLDSALLLVTPVDVQPVTVVQRALKMFEGELQTSDITLNFQVAESYRELNIDWVRLDPSRLLQVLINLTTNAIKFTQSRQARTITVSVGASRERPSRAPTGVTYFARRTNRQDLVTGPDWGTGEEIFLQFDVNDTGRGLSEDEMKLLFIRFSQTTPRTHIMYGGSGLGLFISRELTELQGGEIGVDSESGKGSTFAFYVKARRSSRPSDAIDSPVSTTPSHRAASGKFDPNKHILQNSRASKPDTSVVGVNAARRNDCGHLKVLIVEDNLVNQRVLQKQLTSRGCVVHVANHGIEALERLQESTFWRGRERTGIQLTILLLDLEMPVMDGLTCAKRIRQLEASGEIVRHVPIIAVTANARMEQIETAMEVGMDSVVSKPFRIPELIPKMDELTNRFGDSARPDENDENSNAPPRSSR